VLSLSNRKGGSGRRRLFRATAWHLAALVAASALFLAVPELDLAAARAFYDPQSGWVGQDVAAIEVFRSLVAWAAGLVPAAAVALWLVSLLRRDGRAHARGLAALYLVLCLAVGPGLIAHVILKDHWGRARPSQIVEFGRDKEFTPAPLIADQCRRNCSFVSGEVATAFNFLALAWLASGRWRAVAVAGSLALGLAMSLARLSAGGHFLSDAVFAALIAGLVCAVAYEFVVSRRLMLGGNGV
jgi:lipid A 4'-phosphatase